MRTPSSTYRLQLRPDFGFDAAAAITGYLARLGVSHLYLSPILQAAPGSTHGYDVVDHSRLNAELGGEEAFARLQQAAAEHDLGIVVDVVPNHMAVPKPATLNAQLWSVLRDGPASPYARWFDIDWAAQDRAILMPVLGKRIGQVLADGELSLDTAGDEPLLRYYDSVFPVRRGTETLPLPELVDRQFYRLAYWRVADEELNYRRFFDVDTLAAIRMEDPAVFDATHELLLKLYDSGGIDGFRIDHPDGLADPRDYLRRLSEASGGAWVVVEKILEGEEQLPEDWPTAGTTGYDALNQILGFLLDAGGAEPLNVLHSNLTGQTPDFRTVLEEAKREVLATALRAEVARLVDLVAAIVHDDIALRDFTRRGLTIALVELLVAMPVYRAYTVPGEPAPEESVRIVEQAAEVARAHAPERSDEIALLADLALGRLGRDRRRDEFCVRFQQTCGPVMAKGAEDTAFYRWFRLAALNEVGGDPGHFSRSPDEVHAWAARQAALHPTSMTTLSTHDTKRSEDVRARLALLSEIPAEWEQTMTALREAAAPFRSGEWPDAATDYLLWQTVVGAWPIDADRLTAYLEKASREAKRHTTWTEPNAAYDEALASFARSVLADDEITTAVAAFVERLQPGFRSNVVAQKLLQLTVPGVPDVYQGCELVDLSLVDPDNRREVDYERRRSLLAAVEPALAEQRLIATLQGMPTSDRLDALKLAVTTAALHLRTSTAAFGPDATYEPLATTSGHAFGFVRGGAVATVVTRLPLLLEANGGWAESAIALPEPPTQWRDVLTGRTTGGGMVRLAELLADLPVALLVAE
ncbi:MAG: malto-oligosyltrehalose synthase [Actinomycetes bacterium]